MFRKWLLLLVLAGALVGCSTSTPQHTSKVVSGENATLWFVYKMSEEDYFTKDGVRLTPKPGEHFVLIAADVLKGDPLTLAAWDVQARAKNKLYKFTTVNVVTGTSFYMPEDHLIIGWFFILPDKVWPDRLYIPGGAVDLKSLVPN
jgi:hypothetical protein